MNSIAHFATLSWIGLAMVASVPLSLASPADPVEGGKTMASVAGKADVSGAQTILDMASQSDPAFSDHWALYQRLADRRAPASPSRPDFSGLWFLNAQASDDPRDKAQAARQAIKQAKGSGQGMGDGSGGRGRGGGMGGGRQSRGSSVGMGGRSEMPSREISALIATAEKLDISHQDPMLLVIDENDQRQRLFTDFRGVSVSASGGAQQRVAVAGWEGAALVVETSLNNGSKLIQHYQIDANTGRLMISAAVDLPEMQAVSYRLVYDRLKLGTDAGSQK
jgi:hypothetical protein